MSRAKRCPSCKRSKRKAISEQVRDRVSCSINTRDCYFFETIKEALERKQNIKVVKKEKRNIKVEKKEKPIIRVLKK